MAGQTARPPLAYSISILMSYINKNLYKLFAINWYNFFILILAKWPQFYISCLGHQIWCYLKICIFNTRIIEFVLWMYITAHYGIEVRTFLVLIYFWAQVLLKATTVLKYWVMRIVYILIYCWSRFLPKRLNV